MFDQNNSNTNTNNVPDEVKIEDLVGEGKKYSTVEDLAKAYLHADNHIKKIESENNDLRIKTEAAKSVDDILAGLKGTTENTDSSHTTPTQDPDNGVKEEVDLEKLLEQKLAERDQQSQAATNKKMVIDALSAKYGNRAGEVFEAKAQELGTDLETLSAQAPQLVLQAFGVNDSTPSSSAPSPTSGQRNSEQPSGVTAEVGTKAYLQQLRAAGKLSRSQYYAECQKAISVDAKKFNS